jgi:hypothetical protein
MSPGQVDGVQVVTPPSITITHAKLWWFVPHQASGADTFAILSATGGTVGESATPTAPVLVSDVALSSGTTWLTLADYCSNDDAGAGCTFGGGENPNLELYGSELTLADSALPGGAATGGGLVGTGTLSGVQSMSYNAQDASSGIRLVQLRVDGNVVAQKDYIASCPYSNFLACPPAVSDSIGWNTAGVVDGEHSLELLVESAAQNTSVVYSQSVHTQNATKLGSLGAQPGPGTTSNGSSGPGAANSANGANASTSAEVRLGIAANVTRPFAHSALRLAGRLLDSRGNPIGGASLDIIQRVSGAGASRVVGHPRTNADGTFALAVGAGPSRTISVAYRAFAAEQGYVAQAKITETVHAGVRLRIAPRRIGPNEEITLSGTVAGPIPPQGVIVALLVHYHGSWEPFRNPRTDRRGHFHAGYTFQGAIGRFPFQAEVPAGQAGFAYAAGLSQRVSVSSG